MEINPIKTNGCVMGSCLEIKKKIYIYGCEVRVTLNFDLIMQSAKAVLFSLGGPVS